MARFKV